MKKVLVIIALISFGLPMLAEEATTYSTESVRSFARPNDSRFQYSLPERGAFKFPSRKSAAQTSSSVSSEDDSDEVELDTSDIKPVKKVIKRMSADSEANTQEFDKSNMPMNYDNFPKYYNPNDMSTQQFMPMFGY